MSEREELLELYIGLLSIETNEIFGLAFSHGFRGWPDHLELGKEIRRKLGVPESWSDDLRLRAEKALLEMREEK